MTMALLEAKDRVSQLEAAIQRLDSVKKYLNTNAEDIKSEIRSHVTRSMECLKSRETSLYQQVAHILHTKEERLQRQQTRLKQALNVLCTGLTLVQDDAASELQLAETLQRLKQIELSPEETPYISFRANHVALRDSILHYGRVDGNGLPLLAAFEKPSRPSASLPRQLEDYEDADHHFFHKTVQGTQKANTTTSINVSIPKLSTRMEDWLQKKKQECVSPAVRPMRLAMMVEPGQPSPSGSGQVSTPGSTGSLNSWLATLKQHTDQEEEHDFEIVDNSCPWTGSVARFKESRKTTGTKDFFRHISKDPQHWLRSSPTKSQQGEASPNFFAHITADPKMWLACHQLSALQEQQPSNDLCSHISKDTDSWLRSRAHTKHPSPNGQTACPDKPVSQEAKKSACPDIKNWLANQDLDGLLVSPVPKPINQDLPVSPVPKPINLLTNQDLDGLQVSPVPKPVNVDLKNWLVTQEPSRETANAVGNEGMDATTSQPGFFSHISNNPDVWLMKQGGGSASPREVRESEESPGRWLLLQTGPPAPPSSLVLTGRWLQRPASQQLLWPQDDTLAHMRPVGDSCWLAAPSETTKAGLAATEAASLPDTASWLSPQTPRRHEASPDSDHSDSWSVCSSTLSRTSELHAQDVVLASNFYKKWLL